LSNHVRLGGSHVLLRSRLRSGGSHLISEP
jgi:hypothetical protein